MSEAEVKLLRELNEAFNSGGDWQRFYAPEIELHMPAEWPDDSVYVGLDGLQRALAAWRGGFDEYHWREERVIDVGDGRVVGLYYHRGRDKQAGVWIDQPLGTIFTFRDDGKIIRLDGHFSWAAAVREAGLGDSVNFET